MATWDAASLRWLEGRRDSKWYAKDQGYVDRLNEHLLGVELSAIDKLKVAEIRDALLATRSAGTVNRIMGVLRAVLMKARDDWGMLDSAPPVRRLKEKERLRWITPEEAVRLLDALPTRIMPIAAMALFTGLRSFNVRHLEWTEVDMTRRWISIPGEKMKNGQPLGIPISDDAFSILIKQKGKHPRWVFPVQTKGQVGPLQNIGTEMWKRACAEAGIEDFHFHDLRHTFASWHTQHGTQPLILMQLGGWKDLAMVKRYSHLSNAHLSAAAGNIQGLCISPGKTSRKNSKSAQSKPDG